MAWVQAAQMALQEGERKQDSNLQSQAVSENKDVATNLNNSIKKGVTEPQENTSNQFQIGEQAQGEMVGQPQEEQPKDAKANNSGNMDWGAVASMAGSLNNQQAPQMVSYQPIAQAQPVASDGTEKEDVGEDSELRKTLSSSNPIDVFADIDTFLYKYKPDAQVRSPELTNDVDNFGVMAQQLQENPITSAAVSTDENGYLMLDGGRLSSINTAMIAELCRKVQELENKVYGRG